MSIREILAVLGVKEAVTLGIGILLVLSMVVEVSKIKLNPWSWLAKIIGRAVNAEVAKELAEIKKKLDNHIDTDDRRTADGHRARVLHFNNELLRNIPHTKEEFIEVLTEIFSLSIGCSCIWEGCGTSEGLVFAPRSAPNYPESAPKS